MLAASLSTSFASRQTQRADCPTLSLASVETLPVSDKTDIAPGYMSDSARECAIGLAASRIEHWMGEYENTGEIDHRARADVARMQMEALKAGRSEAQRERLARERAD